MGQVADKSERRSQIEGGGLKSYCVNLGHTAVIDRNCITSRCFLTGLLLCGRWGAAAGRGDNALVLFKAIQWMQYYFSFKHIDSSILNILYCHIFSFVLESNSFTQCNFQIHVNSGVFFLTNNNEGPFATRLCNAVFHSILQNCWLPNYGTFFFEVRAS